MSFQPTESRYPPPGFMPPGPYGPLAPPPMMPVKPKIRHPNRPPCTTPSKTLYIRNLNEKIKIPVLIKALQALFETYGPILEIRARHSIRMRGQAFIVYESLDDAVKAHDEVQGFLLFTKPMFIEYSRMPSEVTIKQDGGDLEAFNEERQKQALKSKQQHEAKSNELPNKILFLQGVPPGVEEKEIEQAFSGFQGFVEVRWVSVKPDVAF
ncbi:hypothetical protein IWW36_005522, partial [Coemansia brasiliensis]